MICKYSLLEIVIAKKSLSDIFSAATHADKTKKDFVFCNHQQW